MTIAAHPSPDALAVQQPGILRLDLEPFHVAAAQQLAAQPLAPVGVCQNPYCSARFTPSRAHQRYCSAACRQADDREFRNVGLRAAPALMAWQMGRYAAPGPLADLSRAGRRYYSALAAAWLRDRQWRRDVAGCR